MVLAVVIQGTLTTLRQSCQQPGWDRPVSRRSRLISVPVVAVFRAIPGSRTVPLPCVERTAARGHLGRSGAPVLLRGSRGKKPPTRRDREDHGSRVRGKGGHGGGCGGDPRPRPRVGGGRGGRAA